MSGETGSTASFSDIVCVGLLPTIASMLRPHQAARLSFCCRRMWAKLKVGVQQWTARVDSMSSLQRAAFTTLTCRAPELESNQELSHILLWAASAIQGDKEAVRRYKGLCADIPSHHWCQCEYIDGTASRPGHLDVYTTVLVALGRLDLLGVLLIPLFTRIGAGRTQWSFLTQTIRAFGVTPFQCIAIWNARLHPRCVDAVTTSHWIPDKCIMHALVIAYKNLPETCSPEIVIQCAALYALSTGRPSPMNLILDQHHDYIPHPKVLAMLAHLRIDDARFTGLHQRLVDRAMQR